MTSSRKNVWSEEGQDCDISENLGEAFRGRRTRGREAQERRAMLR